MAKTKKVKDKEFEEMKKRALEPFKPRITIEEVLSHEEKVMEESFAAFKRMKKGLSEEKKKNILSRANFEKTL